MENPVFTKLDALFGKEIVRFIITLVLCIILSNCASSEVSRTAASNIDLGVQNAKNLLGSGDGDVADAYQNTNQATKGLLIGGTAGAVTGGLAGSGIGTLQGALIGAVLGASYGSYIDTNTSLEDRLENRGATVIVLGDHIMIVLRSARIFYPATSTIKPQSYSTLKLVSSYINQYTKILVKVSAYTNYSGSETADLALSQQQANNVAKMLTAWGVDARILYALGCGGTHLVEKNIPTGNEDGNDNYRIEITLEKLYV